MSSQSLRKRLLLGTGASALGPLVTAFIQIGTVPVFLHFWGARLYGEWLILSAIPTYLALSDFGFGTASGNEMTMRVAAGDRQNALEIFQSTWVLALAGSAVMLIVAAACTWFLPLGNWLKLSVLTGPTLSIIVLALSVYALIGMQGTLLSAAFRCDGNFALGTFIVNLQRLLEGIAAIALVAAGASPCSVALAYVLLRSLTTLGMAALLKRKSPWLHYGWCFAGAKCLRKLLHPALASLAFPTAQVISLQGIIIVIAAILGPVQVVMFSTLRTLTRAVPLITDTIKHAVWPELSAAFGKNDRDLAWKLYLHCCQLCLLVAISCGAGLAFFGAHIYTTWTHGGVSFDAPVFDVLLVVAVANAFWAATSVAPLATNTHGRIAAAFLVSSGISIVLAAGLLRSFGILGGGLALVVTELGIASFVTKDSLATMQTPALRFAAGMFRLPEITLRGGARA